MKCKCLLVVLGVVLALLVMRTPVRAQEPYPVTVVDQTPAEPLDNPTPTTASEPRYISGFGLDGAFTVFFEDREEDQRIFYNQTQSGPLGFSAVSTPTNMTDTHFVVKDWPVVISGTTYLYRGWGAAGNDAQHRFYVSDNLITWTLISTFTIANTSTFTNARGNVYYGFHDVIVLDGVYYAWGESNGGQTMLVSSTLGTDDWLAFASVGGTDDSDGPLRLPESGTPTGSFIPLANNKGYGKLCARGDNSGLYLAVNLAAKPELPEPALAEAFIEPENWYWHDGTTGLLSTLLLSKTAEHDLREAWVVPQSDPDADWTIIYDADFYADGGKALGYTSVIPPRPVDHFIFHFVDEQVETRAFTLTVVAEDAYGYPVTTYTSPVTLRDSTGTLSPTLSADFVKGVLTQTVTISRAKTDVHITATHVITPDIVGNSNAFDVLPLRVTNLDTGERFLTIQKAIDDAETLAGHTLSVTAGIYTETITLHKAVSLMGTGSGGDAAQNTILRQVGSASIVNLTASGTPSAPLGLRDLRVEPTGVAGLEIGAGQSISRVVLHNVHVVGAPSHTVENEIGFKVASDASLTHLTVTHSTFDKCDYGWYFFKHNDWGPGASNVTHITVTHTTFNRNDYKGMYIEKLSDALFDTCTVNNNGHSDFWNQVWNGGVDINLKGEEVYQNLIFRNMTVTNNGLGYKEGAGLMLKARDDGMIYSKHPATLTHVLIEGGRFEGNERGIRLGEPGQDNASPTQVEIHQVEFRDNVPLYSDEDGSAAGDVVNHTLADVDALFNDWNTLDLAEIESLVYHRAESTTLGLVHYLTLTLDNDGASPMADRVSFAVVTATLDGLLRLDGQVISLTTSLGTPNRVTGTTDAQGSVTFVMTSAVAGTASVTATVGMDTPHPQMAVTQLDFLPLTVHHFYVYLMQDQVAGVGFPVVISARDASDKIVTDFNGWGNLHDLSTTLVPTMPIQFHNGVWNDSVTVTRALRDDVITVTYKYDASLWGHSQPFDVRHSYPVSVSLAPATDVLTAGERLTYTVWATDAYGNEWDATDEARYTLTFGAGGTWDAQCYTAQYTGVWTVMATVDGVAATAMLTVVHGTPIFLTLTPDPFTVTLGEQDSVTYTASASDAYGNEWDVTPWAVFHTVEAAGVWLGNVHLPQTGGTWPITVTWEALQDTATLHVITATIAALSLDPVSANVTAGEAITYTCTATDTAGNTWDATGDTYFIIDRSARGMWQGPTYLSEVAGQWQVHAIYGGHVVNADLTVTYAEPESLDLSPKRHTLGAGERVSYTVQARDALGNVWDATPGATYTISHAAGGAWIDNVYLGERAGVWTVTATVGHAWMTATLTVVPGALERIELAPASAMLTIGTRISYTVWARDAQANLWDVTYEAMYAVSEGAGGMWAANWYYSEHAGAWMVTATVGTVFDTAYLTVTQDFVPPDFHALTVNVTGQGTVTRVPSATEYTHGSVVTLTAHPAPGWAFAGWTGDVPARALASRAPTLTLTLDAPHVITATFMLEAEPSFSIFLPVVTNL